MFKIMSFVCFLGEVTAWQFCFEIDWPLCSSIKLFCHRHSSIDFLQILFWAATPQIIYKHAMLLQISRRISIKLLLNLWAHDFAKSTTAQRLNLLVFRPVDWLPISTYCSEFRFVKLANITSVHCSVLQSYILFGIYAWLLFIKYLGLFSKGFEDQGVKIPPLLEEWFSISFPF